MNKLFLTVLLVLVVASNAFAWTTKDTYRELAWQGLHVVDYGQTKGFLHDENSKYQEGNPLLSKQPNDKELLGVAVLQSVAHVVTAKLLPPKPRMYFQYFTLYTKINTVARAYSLGIDINF